jgi:hypothetical protein
LAKALKKAVLHSEQLGDFDRNFKVLLTNRGDHGRDDSHLRTEPYGLIIRKKVSFRSNGTIRGRSTQLNRHV